MNELRRRALMQLLVNLPSVPPFIAERSSFVRSFAWFALNITEPDEDHKEDDQMALVKHKNESKMKILWIAHPPPQQQQQQQ